jgi:hypothetical protein
MWGAVYFQKMHFIKIAFTFFIALTALVLLNYSFMKALLGTNVRSVIPFASVTLQDGEYQYFNLNVFQQQKEITLIGFMLMAVALWLASYMRLKEKQV